MNDMHPFQKDFLEKNNIPLETLKTLSDKETKMLRHLWEDTYISLTKRKNIEDLPSLHFCPFCKSKDNSYSYNWHIFSSDRTPCHKVQLDFFKNREINEENIILLWEECAYPGIELTSGNLKTISFDVECCDIYVFPRNLDWTFVSTHENGWIGPFYSEKSFLNKDV